MDIPPVRFKVFLILAASLALASCVKDRPFAPGPGLTLVGASELPPPDGAVDSQGRSQILISSFDRLGVKVFRAADFDGSYDVGGTGIVTLPLVGPVLAAGKTADQLEDDIAEQLRGKYLRDPQVVVEIQRSNTQQVTVEGEVTKPGIYPITGESTLLQSIAKAEGTTEFSKLTDVVVFRSVGKNRMAALYNLDLIRRGTYSDPQIYAGDVVVVGDSPARRRFKDILTGSTLVATPIIALLQNL